jgi:hypothetical protein
MLTKPTPATCDKRMANRFSTMSCTWVIGKLPELMAKLRMGASAGLTLLYAGDIGKSLGKTLEVALIAACTCCSATSSGSFKENRKVMTEAPPELTDVIKAKPGI